MKTELAEQNLQVIRTLMERSAIYRRALGPIMWWAGGIAVVSAVAGKWVGEEQFSLQWAVTGIVIVIVAFVLARRQARRDNEVFWSPPARKVALAMLPPLVAIATISGFFFWESIFVRQLMVGVWAMLYGCALNAAGIFAPRGLRILGWMFLMCGLAWWFLLKCLDTQLSPSVAMGVIFGGLHLCYAAYLTITKRES
jgi:hypothetical protein